jgi:protein ImuA
VAAPGQPCVAALLALGLAPSRLVCVEPASTADAAWAAEQALRSGALGAVLWWQGDAPVLPATLRRLHLAATEGGTPVFALRPAAQRAQSSPAPLRLALDPVGRSRLAVDVFKRRGPPMAAPLELTLPGPSLRRPRRAAAAPVIASQEQPHAVVRPAPERVAA